ncbi:hypothetical protein BKA62DRAFT_640384 [Auriculariales sp. MPI-PUGE-AT-0066]|nr:hypothetical protein BKA62DRAFT_640384 [Auriculariales sp. MPI-PUGE-AT-0066]
MKLKEIHRTATFAWAPTQSVPLLATGGVAGALDESFSNDSTLEIWAPNFADKNEFDLGRDGQPKPIAHVKTTARFNRLAWGYVQPNHEQGFIAAGMENGELSVWNPEKIVADADPTESLVFTNNIHTGPVRGLDFNTVQTNLLASGAVNGEVQVWDMTNTANLISPGARSQKLDEITSLAWNRQVPYILGTSSTTGYTVVWDLRTKREVVALQYAGGAGTVGNVSAAGGALGAKRGMSDVCWHPDSPTRLVTSSEDDTSPVIMVWDLRNARAPEKLLEGHHKGVLSMSWCKQDSDLLLSCGKDNRTLCWNPQTSEIIGELPAADNWAFQVEWCPKNPDLLATAYFDGTIGVHSLQSTNEDAAQPGTAAAPRSDGSDVFDVPGYSQKSQAKLSLKQPPKWLRRSTSVAFGYGGQLVTVSNLPGANGKNQSSVVHLAQVVTEPTIVERAQALLGATTNEGFVELAEKKAAEGAADAESWKALLSLFRTNSREELVTLLGFSKDDIAIRVAAAVKKLQENQETQESQEAETATETESVTGKVSFVEPDLDVTPEPGSDAEAEAEAEAAETTSTEPSELSDMTKPTADSSATELSLFGDDVANEHDVNANFFSSMGALRNAIPDHVRIPHYSLRGDSSAAATIGSGPPSVISEAVKQNTFKIYPTEESETDRLLTKALVLGDFESAVALCLAVDRFADAILLAAKGSPELLQRTQKAYFERRTVALPYLRLFQSIVTDDLEDIVQNADLREWQEIFVVMCTFAKSDHFPSLAEQLGQRLEFQGSLLLAADPDDVAEAHEFRKHATLAYLAARRLEKVVNIWIAEMSEEETRVTADAGAEGSGGESRYTTHALALQSFIEKVTVFRHATGYTDEDLLQTPAPEAVAQAKTYKLGSLYDRYFEYADLLASQGLVQEAVKYLDLTPADYTSSTGTEESFSTARNRLLAAAGKAKAPVASGVAKTAAAASTYNVAITAKPAAPGYPSYAGQTARQYPPASQSYNQAQQQQYPQSNTYGQPGGAYQHQQHQHQQQQPAPSVYAPPSNPYGPSGTTYTPAGGASGYQPSGPTYPGGATRALYPPGGAVPAPLGPPPGPAAPPQLPPPPKRDAGGWNDAPASVLDKKSASTSNSGKSTPAPIMAPFANMSAPASPTMSTGGGFPPPPRGSTPGAGPRPGPPSGPALRQTPPPPPAGPPSTGFPRGPLPPGAPPPATGPGRVLSPLGAGQRVPPRGPAPVLRNGPGTVLPPPPHATATPPPPPPSQFRGPPPPPGQQQFAPPPPPGGGYAPPPPSGHPAAAPTGYGPPPGAQGFAPPPPGPGFQGPPPPGPPRAGPPPPGGPASSAPPPPRAAPPPQTPAAPKYPPGDREHIPDATKPIYNILFEELNRFKATTPAQQQRMADDVGRRVNTLFDALNCDAVSSAVLEGLGALSKAIQARDRPAATAIHMDLLTRASASEDIGLWMSGLKQMIQRL